MSNIHGADPERLDALARLFDAEADHLRQVLADSRSLADQAVWAGADAEAFRRHVADDLGSSIVRSSDALRRGAEALRRNASEQRHASGGPLSDLGLAAAVPASVAAARGVADGGRAIGDVLHCESAPPPDWHASPRVAALIAQLGSTSDELAGAGPSIAEIGAAAPELTPSTSILGSDTTSAWAVRLFGVR